MQAPQKWALRPMERLTSPIIRTLRECRRRLVHVPELFPVRVSTYDEWQRRAERLRDEHVRRSAWEDGLIPSGEESFWLPGFCVVCRRQSSFLVDYLHSAQGNGRRLPNWRERLECRRCGFTSRLRATIQLFEQECGPALDKRIYITEATTDLFQYVGRRYHQVEASEYLADACPFGSTDSRGIRNEDLTALTFPDESFDVVLCFEVLEHIPDYRSALSEALRVLRPGGVFFFSAPFRLDLGQTLIRATVNGDGSVTHLVEPEYHGDPLSPDGILCFYHFGWDLLDCMRDLGYKRVEALLYWSPELGHLGGEQALFSAVKE